MVAVTLAVTARSLGWTAPAFCSEYWIGWRIRSRSGCADDSGDYYHDSGADSVDYYHDNCHGDNCYRLLEGHSLLEGRSRFFASKAAGATSFAGANFRAVHSYHSCVALDC